MNHEPTPVRRPSYVKWVVVGIFAVLAVVLFLPIHPIGEDVSSMRIAQARNEVRMLKVAMAFYETEYGTALTGTPGEMMRALMGSNPKKIVFFEADARRFSPEGGFLDPWKQPYHLDTTWPEHPLVYSSGPNRQDELDAVGSDDIVSWR